MHDATVKIVPVCFDLYGESTDGLCLQKVEFFNVKPGGAYCNQRTLKELTLNYTIFVQPSVTFSVVSSDIFVHMRG